METIAPGGGLSGRLREKSMRANRLATALADSLLRQGRLEEADRAIRLAARFAEAEQADAA